MVKPAPHIFTIPPGADFTAALARGVMQDAQDKNIPLADYLLLLPTRRACRIAQDAFLKQADKHAMLLPRLQPLGDLDAEELSFAELSASVAATGDIPPAIVPLERKIRLSAMLRRHDAALSADGAYLLAGALADLLDRTQIEQLDFSGLENIVPGELAEHWQEVLRFLHIVTAEWPQILAAEGLIDPAAHRNLLLLRQAALWKAQPPPYPIIAAGSTGSMPATAVLLDVIAHLPQGAVILPGLDQDCDAELWDAITATHPQYLLKALLDKIGCERRAVKIWPGGSGTGGNQGRIRLLQASFAPAADAAEWRPQDLQPIPVESLDGLSRYECENLEEEARVIALRMRQVLETPERTGMLVTRNRQLAERVAAQLRRWDIIIDDSAGQNLAATECGSLLLLTIAAAGRDASAVDLLALLQHPRTALGLAPAVCRERARLAERLLWRGRRLRGTMPVHAQVAAELAAKNKIPADDAHELADLFDRLDRALRPFAEILRQDNAPLQALLEAHMQAAEMLAGDDVVPGAMLLWRHDDGAEAAALLHELSSCATPLTLAHGDEYAALFRSICAEPTVRPGFGLHPRLSILGPLEARMASADCVILGGMNESSWPGAGMADPWMSRPERQIGQAAHHYLQLASRPDVVMTRARRVDNQPAAPSRFLLRLETVLAALGYKLPAALPLQDWARGMDAPGAIRNMPMPKPRPPLARRPRRFSVTEIGMWRGNPYGFYAKHVLRLRPLGDLDPDFSHADQGIIIHDLLAQFTARYPDHFPDAEVARAELMRMGRDAFAQVADQPAVFASWWARFENTARWFVPAEAERRQFFRPLALECKGALPITLDGIDYTLTGRPDRIDIGQGGLAIIDYKTGGPPSDAQIRYGYEPQLPLLGLMAQSGAFTGIAAAPVIELGYWHLKGRAGDPEAPSPIKEPQARIVEAETMLHTMLRQFADPAMPYLVMPQPRYIPRYDDYRHLGRIDEWGTMGEAA